MNIDFNNVRKKACRAYNSLAIVLNDTMEDGVMTVYDSDIKDIMDELRNCLVSIACTYSEGNDGFKDVSDEVGEFVVFNDEDDE